MSVLLANQSRFLRAVWSLGLSMTDASLRAALAELDEDVGEQTPRKWRQGDRTVSLGLLPVLLHHLDGPRDVAAVLGLLGRPHGVRVVVAPGSVEAPEPADLRCLSHALAGRVLDLTHAVDSGNTPAGAAELARDLRHMAALVDALGGRED